MHTTAHPDDENNGLLVMLNRGQGYRTALATATRGNGGQNEIGPEIFEALGVLRTGELAALHRFDGAEQYFTRAVDFGYSFSIEETFENLTAIVDGLRRRGTAVVLVGVSVGLLSDPYAARYEALAREKAAALVPDILGGIIGHGDLMSDAIHPNGQGYEIMADRLEPVLRDLLSDD